MGSPLPPPPPLGGAPARLTEAQFSIYDLQSGVGRLICRLEHDLFADLLFVPATADALSGHGLPPIPDFAGVLDGTNRPEPGHS